MTRGRRARYTCLVRIRRAFGIGMALALLLGCGRLEADYEIEPGQRPPEVLPHPAYDALFPTWVELCAVGQFRKLDGRQGGPAGHGVLYLHGVCLDRDAGVPTLRGCAPGEASGVGVSVSPWLANASWVGIPGRELFLDGALPADDPVNHRAVNRAVARVLSAGAFDGIELRDYPGSDGQPDLVDFVSRHSLGTDFAIRFARAAFCSRVPVTPEMLAAAAGFLNDVNREHAEGTVTTRWSGYHDRCVHTLHNALAAAGIWKPKSVRATKARQFFNLAVPANTFVDLAFLTNEYPIEDFGAIRGDPLRWKGLLEEKWLPAEPGALVKTLPVHQVNDLYDNKLRIFVLPGLLRNDTVKRAQRLLSDGRYLQIDANLRFFHDRYEAILARRDRRPGLLSRLFQPGEPGDREIYYDYLERARDEVLTLLQELQERDAEGAGSP